MNRLEILKASLQKKQEKFDNKLSEHFADVKSANGQPLNDKRCGLATMSRWDKQNDALNNLQKEIKKTENAINREESKIKGVEYITSLLPVEIVSLIEEGTLIQWRKYPHIFFVNGVDKARIIWDLKKKQVARKFTSSLQDKEQYKKFAKVYNSLACKINMKKLILLSVLAFVVSSCGYEIRRKSEPPKPKLTKEQIRKQEYEQRLKDYDVKFLFECNGVKVYRFIDGREVIYFTDANGMTRYQYATRAGLVSNQTHRVQSINTRR